MKFQLLIITGFFLVLHSYTLNRSACEEDEASICLLSSTKKQFQSDDSCANLINHLSYLKYKLDSKEQILEDQDSRIDKLMREIDIMKSHSDFYSTTEYQIEKDNKFPVDSFFDSTSIMLNKKIIELIDSACRVKEILLNREIEYRKQINTEIETLRTNAKQCSDSILICSQKLNGAIKIKYMGVGYSIFLADLDSVKVRMFINKQNSKFLRNSFKRVISILQQERDIALMVTNGGMYKRDYSPQGLFIEYSHSISQIDTLEPKTDANFYLIPNGIFYIDTNNRAYISETKAFKKNFPECNYNRIRFATQSGPMLLEKGKINNKFTKGSKNKKIRNAVGIVASNKVVFVISDDECNFYDLAGLFKDLFGCNEALYLDGAISQMYLSGIDSNNTGGYFGPIISVSKKQLP